MVAAVLDYIWILMKHIRGALPPAVNIDENLAYGRHDYDYIYDITTL